MGAKNPVEKQGAIIHHLKVVHCVLPKAPCRELDDFRKSPLLQSSRGSYTSPALSCDSYPFVDLPPMNDCKQSFTVSKFIFSPRPC